MAAKFIAAILILAGILGARGSARELAAPFEGLDGLAQARTSPAPEPPVESQFEYEIPPAPPAEPEFESGTMATLVDDAPAMSERALWKKQAIASLPEDLRENSDHRQAIEVFYLRDVGGAVEEFEVDIISRPPPPGGWDIGGVGFTDIDERAGHPPDLAVWKQWRKQAIASLPERLRNDSEYRKAIDHQYHLLISPFVDTSDDWTPNRPPVGGYDIGGVGFTDLDEWAAFWEDWKARAIEALPEAERNDPNRLKEIDTTLELVKQGTGGTSSQSVQGEEIARALEISLKKARMAVK